MEDNLQLLPNPFQGGREADRHGHPYPIQDETEDVRHPEPPVQIDKKKKVTLLSLNCFHRQCWNEKFN